MKNAEDVAKELVERFSGMTFSGGLGTGWLISEIAKALEDYANERILELFEGEDCKVAQIEQDAYRKGEEDMRERAAEVAEKRVVHNARLDYDSGWNRAANLIEDEIKSLPLTEGGAK